MKISQKEKLKVKLQDAIKRRREERLAESIRAPIEASIQSVASSINKLDNSGGIVELKETIKGVTVPDTSENIDRVAEKIEKTSSQTQAIQKIQTGKLNSVEKTSQKQLDQQLEANKISRQVKASVDTTRDDMNAQFAIFGKSLSSIPESMNSAIDKIPRPDLSNLQGSMESIDDTLSQVWNPKERAFNVIVKNQIQPTGGGMGYANITGASINATVVGGSIHIEATAEIEGASINATSYNAGGSVTAHQGGTWTVNTNDTDIQYALIVVEGTNVTYVAEAAPGSSTGSSVWRCKKIDESSGTIITWADGDANFDNTATGLTSLTYI